MPRQEAAVVPWCPAVRPRRDSFFSQVKEHGIGFGINQARLQERKDQPCWKTAIEDQVILNLPDFAGIWDWKVQGQTGGRFPGG